MFPYTLYYTCVYKLKYMYIICICNYFIYAEVVRRLHKRRQRDERLSVLCINPIGLQVKTMADGASRSSPRPIVGCRCFSSNSSSNWHELHSYQVLSRGVIPTGDGAPAAVAEAEAEAEGLGANREPGWETPSARKEMFWGINERNVYTLLTDPRIYLDISVYACTWMCIRIRVTFRPCSVSILHE